MKKQLALTIQLLSTSAYPGKNRNRSERTDGGVKKVVWGVGCKIEAGLVAAARRAASAAPERRHGHAASGLRSGRGPLLDAGLGGSESTILSTRR